MAKRRKVGNLLALGLLSLLSPREPMYPYEMAQTLKMRGKEQSITINWGSLYTVVRNLEKYGFIEAVATEREGRQPERTTYRITDAGLAELKDWLRELLSLPDEEPTRFESALADWMVLGPDEVADLLTRRLETLDKAAEGLKESLATWIQHLPRLFLVEAEYRLAMRVAEAGWVRGLLAEIVDGSIVDERLGGIAAWRRFAESGEIPPEARRLDEQARKGWPEEHQ
ncbi:MAG: PadR family transcriptional regulator [Trebonia sp.]